MKKYIDILDLTLTHLYGPWDLEKFHARTSSWALVLGKIPDPSFSKALGLGKILSSASIQALRFKKLLSFSFLQLQPVGEVPFFCLHHISSKLFL